MSEGGHSRSDPQCHRARALQDHALSLRHAGEVDKALEAALEAQRIVDAGAQGSVAAELWLLIGNCHADKGEYDAAEKALTRAAESFSEDSRNVEYAQAMIGRGRVLAERGDEGSALRFFLDLVDLGLPPRLQSQILNNIGVLYRRSGDLGEAIDFLLRDVALCEQTGDHYGAAVAHLNVASALAEADRKVAAKDHTTQAARVFESIGMHDLAARARH